MDKKQRPRYYNRAFIGPLYSKMHICLQSPVIGVKGQETLEEEMKCHLRIF